MGGKQDIFFIYLPEKKDTGTGILRVRQLAELFREVVEPTATCVRLTKDTNQRSSTVILTKYVAQTISLEDVVTLRRNGNTIVVDIVDSVIRNDLMDLCDVLIASSIEQFEFFRQNYAAALCHLITHHVDVRIPEVRPDHATFRAAYFGEPLNAKYADVFARTIDIYPVKGPLGRTDWFEALPHYGLHYAVRKRRPVDGFKPFIKGFVAAHCQANILIQRSELEAVRYLTREYPFIVEHDDVPGVYRSLELARESYGGPEWRHGLEIMREVRHRSSRAWVLNEIREFVQLLQQAC